MMPVTPHRVAVVVAHPDDEIIFFGGLIRRLTVAGCEVDVVCVSGRFYPHRMTAVRRMELRRSGWLLGTRTRLLDLADEPGMLDPDRLDHQLAQLRWSDYATVYTHGVSGEYGHAHHIQVCRAVHAAAGGFAQRVMSLSGPLPPEDSHVLDTREYATKCGIARAAYPSQPFAADWCTQVERFSVLDYGLADRLTALALRSYPDQPGQAAIMPVHPELARIPPEVWAPGQRQRLAALSIACSELV